MGRRRGCTGGKTEAVRKPELRESTLTGFFLAFSNQAYEQQWKG